MEKDTPLEIRNTSLRQGAFLEMRNTNITNGVLAVPTPITISGNSYTLAINTKVFFDASGSRIQGKVSDTQYVIYGDVFSFNAAPIFHTNGMVSIGNLAVAKTVTVVDTSVDPAFTNTYSFTQIRFHENGAVHGGFFTTATPAKVVDTSVDRCHQHLFFCYYRFPHEWHGVGWESYFCDRSGCGG